MENHLAKDWAYIDRTKVFVDGSGAGKADHLNAKRTPDDVLAATDFAYLTTDGSTDAPYLKAEP